MVKSDSTYLLGEESHTLFCLLKYILYRVSMDIEQWCSGSILSSSAFLCPDAVCHTFSMCSFYTSRLCLPYAHCAGIGAVWLIHGLILFTEKLLFLYLYLYKFLLSTVFIRWFLRGLFPLVCCAKPES